MQVAQQQVGEDQPAVVTLYDFRQGSKLAPDQMREVEEVLQNLARVLRRTLGVYLNASVWLELQALSQGSGEQYLRNLPDQPITALFELLPHTPKAVWQMDAPLAYGALHCMLGGRPDNCELITERELSPVEAAVLRRFCKEILDTWALTWPLLDGQAPVVKEVVGDIAQVDVELRHEQVVIALIEANFAGQEGRMWLGLPAGILQMMLRKVETKAAGKQISSALLSNTGATEVKLHVYLAQQMMWLSALQELQEGMQIDLEHHVSDPVAVYLAGKKKFLARTGTQRGRLAVQITEVVG